MDLETILGIIFSGAGITALGIYLTSRNEKKKAKTDAKRIELEKKRLALEEEKQRTEDLPKLEFGNYFQTSPITRELKIEIVNTGNDCHITEICPSNQNWKYLTPRLPIQLGNGHSVILEFYLPKKDPVLIKTFSKFTIFFSVLDRHNRIYSASFNSTISPSHSSVQFTPMVLVKP